MTLCGIIHLGLSQVVKPLGGGNSLWFIPGLLPEPFIGGVGGEVGVVAPPVILWRVGAVRLDLGDI